MRWLCGALAAAGAVAAAPIEAEASTRNRAIIEVPLSFEVRNTNTSLVDCGSDGRTYQVEASLVGTKSALVAPVRTATLYLHGLNGNLWRFGDAPGYDLAVEMAKLGHVSIVVDRLGYTASDIPGGFDTCLGAQADMAHQVVSGLRRANYRAHGMQPVPFHRIAIAGHSAGGGIAEVEAYSYRDVNALVVLGHADSGFSAGAGEEVGRTSQVCGAGGEPKHATTGPNGYAFLPTSHDTYQRLFFSNADPDVVTAATQRRERDPCGDLASFFAMLEANQAHLGQVTVPVLLVYGRDDAIFAPDAPEAQRARFTSAPTTLAVLEQTGHVMMLERTAPVLHTTMHNWLVQHGF